MVKFGGVEEVLFMKWRVMFSEVDRVYIWRSGGGTFYEVEGHV